MFDHGAPRRADAKFLCCTDAKFLFCIEPQSNGRVVILVQSATAPDWDYAFHNAGYLLSAAPRIITRETSFPAGEQLRFRLTANPTKKIGTKTGPDGKRNNGRRVPVRDEELDDWLERRARNSGFMVQRVLSTQTGFVYFDKRPAYKASATPDGQAEKARLRSVCYEGLLEVTHTGDFQKAIIHGIGPEKAFGFGLLCLARM